MAITLGTFSKLDDGVFAGTFKTLNVSAALTVVPVDKTSDKAPDSPGLCRTASTRVGAGWSQVAKSSREDLSEPQNRGAGLCGAPHKPEFGPSWVRCRLVKLEHPAEDGSTHIALWEPRDRLHRKAPPRSPRAGLPPFPVTSVRVDSIRRRRTVGSRPVLGEAVENCLRAADHLGPLRASSRRDR